MGTLDYRQYWERALPWRTYLEDEVHEHRALWQGVDRKTAVPEWALAQLRQTGRRWHLLVLAEDWCGDAVNTVPVLGRLGEADAGVETRILKRDENPELMDAYLTNGGRSIPLAIVLDDDFQPVGRWGPRPAELQEYVLREKRAGALTADEIYKQARIWYARDRGETTLREVLALTSAAGEPAGHPSTAGTA